jgi:hypothetical protein
MFHYRGAALFAGVGLAVVSGFVLLSRHAPRLARASALVGAAVALRSSATLGWAGADVPDGSRFKASPVGLSHVLTPDQLESRTVDCGWHSTSGYRAPCAVADPGAFARLRIVYPLILVAVMLALGGAVLSIGQGVFLGQAQRALAAAAAIATLGGLVVFALSIRSALAAIADLPVGVGGTLGTMQVSLALLLLLTAALPPAPGQRPSRNPSEAPASVAASA